MNQNNPFTNYLSIDNIRFNKQMEFIAEVDKMTQIMRKTLLLDKSRRENDAEHSWHLAIMAMLLSEYCSEEVSVDRAIKMVLVHDLIEIYAGDTFAYDEKGNESKLEREKAAADRLYSILPEEQGKALRSLWEEFDLRATADSRFASSMDVLQPFFHNTLTDGGTWREFAVKKSAVLNRLSVVKESLPSIWDWVLLNVDRAVKNAWLLDE